MSPTPKASETTSNLEMLDDDSEWTTVVEESGRPITFATAGDTFTGIYVGTVTLQSREGESFDQQRFRDSEGVLYAINGGFKLKDGLKAVAEGETVRIVYMGDIDTGQPSPMKDFRVDVKRSANPAVSPVAAVEDPAA